MMADVWNTLVKLHDKIVAKPGDKVAAAHLEGVDDATKQLLHDTNAIVDESDFTTSPDDLAAVENTGQKVFRNQTDLAPEDAEAHNPPDGNPKTPNRKSKDLADDETATQAPQTAASPPLVPTTQTEAELDKR